MSSYCRQPVLTSDNRFCLSTIAFAFRQLYLAFDNRWTGMITLPVHKFGPGNIVPTTLCGLMLEEQGVDGSTIRWSPKKPLKQPVREDSPERGSGDESSQHTFIPPREFGREEYEKGRASKSDLEQIVFNYDNEVLMDGARRIAQLFTADVEQVEKLEIGQGP